MSFVDDDVFGGDDGGFGVMSGNATSKDSVPWAQTKKTTGGRPKKAKAGSSFTVYTTENIVEFIHHIEQHPIAWDSSLDNSHRKENSLKVFDNIEEQCKHFLSRGKSHGSVAKELWAQLKSAYDKEMLKIQKTKSGSGVSSSADSFPFAAYMSFLDGAAHKRQVKNTYVLGADEFYLSEMFEEVEKENGGEDLEEKKNSKVFAGSCDLELADMNLRTPKRKLQMNETHSSKRSKKRPDTHTLLEMINQSNKDFVEALKETEKEKCGGSERIGNVFRAHTEGWSDLDKSLAEAKVMLFIHELKKPGPENIPSNYPRNQDTLFGASSSSSYQDTSLFDLSFTDL